MNRVYEKIKNDENFKDKLKLDEPRNCLTIVFNKYLSLEYFEGDYKSASDEGVIFLKEPKNAAAHWHITEDEEALETITDFANGSDVYIENTNSFSLFPLRVMPKTKFEKKKKRYMEKKSLRIYTVNSIIKRSTK